MTIYDRARDALESPHSFVYGGEYAAAVVRAAELADAMDQEAHYLRFDCMDEEADYRQEAAARIRKALEGVEE